MITGVSCMTTYDAYGRPVQSVDPGMAALGVAAAGIAGYAIANNQRRDRGYHRNRGYHHHRGPIHPHQGYYGQNFRRGWY